MIDAYRFLHGYKREAFSWFLKQTLRIGRRFDHLFVSPNLQITRCEYLRELRECGLSDQAPLDLDLKLGPSTAA
jgi:exonuclease III